MNIKVTLRKKPISKGRESLFLDFYPPIVHPTKGTPTRREYLNKFIYTKPKNPFDKTHNADAMAFAESVRQRRQNELDKPEIYSAFEKAQLKIKEQGEMSFIDYFKKLTNERKTSNHDNWVSASKYLISFTNGQLKFEDITEQWCNDFKKYLLNTKSNKSSKTTLAINSAVSYFNKVKATLKQAYRDGLLQADLNAKIAPIETADTRRNFLTLDEVQLLAKTECLSPILKQAALFSALTGLRFSDMKKMVWSEVVEDGDEYALHFTQQKTGAVETMPIGDTARQLLGERKEPTDRVFTDLTYSAYHNKFLYQWLGLAGITKDITFHCFRHTYATLQIGAGTDLYVVSKMLGHKDIKTTQIYAKMVNAKKKETVNKIAIEL
jgi:integrase